MTAIDWLVNEVNTDCLNSTFIRQEIIEKAKEIEKEHIINAMFHALDEDGHTGDWKIKFVNDYYDKTFK